MEKVYKWARVTAVIFTVFLFLVCSMPFVVIAIKGVDESSIPMLMTSLFFLLFLVLFALSFRFMHKNESIKKRRIGLTLFITMLISLIVYSFYAEEKRLEYENMKQEKISNLQTIHEEKAISTALKYMIEDLEKNKIEETSK